MITMEKGRERKGREKELGQNTQSVKWLGLHASSVGGAGLIPGQGTRIPHTTTTTTKVEA